MPCARNRLPTVFAMQEQRFSGQFKPHHSISLPDSQRLRGAFSIKAGYRKG